MHFSLILFTTWLYEWHSLCFLCCLASRMSQKTDAFGDGLRSWKKLWTWEAVGQVSSHVGRLMAKHTMQMAHKEEAGLYYDPD